MIAVVGGGVVGATIAFELIERGVEVTLYERKALGGGATAAAAGMLAPVAEAESEDAEWVRFAVDSARRYPRLLERIERRGGERVALAEAGTLWVAGDRDDLAELDRLAATLDAKGLAARRLDGARTREREPRLAPRVVGALELADDRQVDPRRLVAALGAAIVAGGGTIVEGVEVSSIEADADGWRLAADGEERRFDGVVIASGARAGSLLRETVGHGDALADPGLALRPVKGQLLRLRGEPLLRHVVRAPDVYLVPRADGELLVGATVEEVGFDRTATAGAVMDLLREAWRLLPAIYDLQLVEISVGLRPASGSAYPRIDRLADGLWTAVGHYRNGVLLAPATGALLADWIAEGRRPRALLPFAISAKIDGER